MRKQRDARIVKFEQDYAPGGIIVGEKSGLPMAKGTTHAMHTDTVEYLKSLGVKMKVEKPDFAILHAKAKDQRAKAIA